MERKAFTLLHDMEGSWWYRGRAAAIRSAIWRGVGSESLQKVLDFGAGFGGMAAQLKSVANEVYAFEPDAEAKTVAEQRGYAEVFSSVEGALEQRYSLIGLFDVVEHIENDDTFIKQMSTALLPAGYLAITVPAFPFLWSVHDVTHHHFRRYTKASMRQLLTKNGFEITYMSYWNMSLFIPAALMRLLGKSSGESAIGLPQVLDDLFFVVVYLESLVMRFLPLPFGIGLVIVAKKI